MKLILGDSLQRLKDLPTATVDCIVTDPPWAIKFMSRKWDYEIPSVDLWREALRVLKPGGHILVCCGTRTQHRMVVNIEDAGFEVRDVVTHLYGSGFPKSLSVDKAIDKAAGAEREVVGKNPSARPNHGNNQNLVALNQLSGECVITAPATDDAKRWQGWGTALKPACEFWTLARKPLEKGLTVAENVLKYGTGALNIDASRIASADKLARPFNEANNEILGTYARFGNPVEPSGRWPANVLFDESAAAVLDEQSGPCKTGNIKAGTLQGFGKGANTYGEGVVPREFKTDAATGASRFFYVAKSSKRDRSSGGVVNNTHPTCKPTKLMEYLITLVCPSGGIVLDPFLGSGSTLVAAARLGVQGIGIEREAEYLEIARRRIEHAAKPDAELEATP